MVIQALVLGWLGAAGAAEAPLPPAGEVVARMLERSAEVARAENPAAWIYDKVTVMEELGDNGQVKETTEKLYRVRMFRGVPFSRLVGIQGRPLSEAELRKEDKREAEFQKRVSGRDPGKVAGQREAMIKQDLVDRYRFEVKKREVIGGRPTLKLTFGIASDKPAEKTLQDRILNRLAGTVWVDEASSEVTRLNIHLTKGFSLGLLGILGSLSDCRFFLARQPMPDGTWLPVSQETQITGRKLSTSLHFRVKEESKNFKPEPTT